MTIASDPAHQAASLPSLHTWHPLALTGGIALAAALFGSWRAGWWATLDTAVFRFFNAQLGEPGALQTFWAITNWRPFDLVAALTVAVLVLLWLREGGDAEKKLAQFFAFCVLLLVAKACEHVISDVLHVRRLSPTLALPDVVRLSELISWVQVKDRGATVFPGDHAFALFAGIGFFWLHASRKFAIAATVVLLPFMVPRIAVGAHWLTDVMVGGMCMALLMLGAAYATPLASRLSQVLETHAPRALAGCTRLIRRVGLLR
jgi:membrane-associated phospholipid phosphatase